MGPQPHQYNASTRATLLSEASGGSFDILIVGGGIHGASLAEQAARAGHRVLLLEAEDYAQGTSSRSSKLLHGGVRYLEQGDFGLVHEALQERRTLLGEAPHLTRLIRFLFPVIPGRTRPGWQLRLGLKLYDFLARGKDAGSKIIEHLALDSPAASSSVLAADDPECRRLRELGLDFSRMISYADGQMDDARIVIEKILSARAEGAITLNYARMINGVCSPEAYPWTIRALDCVGGATFEARARVLVNVSGPWVPEVEQHLRGLRSSESGRERPVAYSRGTHILFDGGLIDSGLILPTGEKGRYYFVLPLFSPWRSRVLVGTTDRALPANEDNPRPSESEMTELLGYLERDIPGAGLHRAPIAHAFSGTRILSAGESETSVSKLSRAEEIYEDTHYLALAGGKYTTARSTAAKLLQRAERLLGTTSQSARASEPQLLPGAVGWSPEAEGRLAEALATEFSLQAAPSTELKLAVAGAVGSLGMRAAGLSRYRSEAMPVSASAESQGELSQFTRAVTAFLVAEEQAVTSDDIWERRLGLGLGLPPEGFFKAKIASHISELTENSGNVLKKEEQQAIITRNNI